MHNSIVILSSEKIVSYEVIISLGKLCTGAEKFLREIMQLPTRNSEEPVYSYNEPSNRLCEKIGLVIEGRRRNTVFTDGKFYDEILYGLTKDEFSELIK